ncbi:MAG: hypothetical protein N3H32_00025 [Nitrososphaeria archaeon]|nr:hypothetical protein [Nitrososphaeria archaeon]
MMLQTLVEKFRGNPIISPIESHGWESRQTFNPGAVEVEGAVRLLYRAIGEDGVSRLGYAVSRDGLNVSERLPHPVFEHDVSVSGPSEFRPIPSGSGGSVVGAEDPRLAAVGGEVFMTYTIYDGFNIRVAIASILAEDLAEGRWRWRASRVISPPHEKHKNWVVFPRRFDGRIAILHSLPPRVQIAYVEDLESLTIRSEFDGGYAMGRRGKWDAVVRGAAAPPIETSDGWLLFYHASPAREVSGYGYMLGAMLLDAGRPEVPVSRTDSPLLVPTEWYEFAGFKPGVIYVTGAVRRGDEVFLYYGAADSHVAVATVDLNGLLSYLSRR